MGPVLISAVALFVFIESVQLEESNAGKGFACDGTMGIINIGCALKHRACWEAMHAAMVSFNALIMW